MNIIPVTTAPHVPMAAATAAQLGRLDPVDARKKKERRRLRRQEKRAWMDEFGLN